MSLIARLIEAGTPADLIEEVALLVVEKRAVDERRAKDAARKREERDAARAAVSTDIHGHPGQARTSEEFPLSRPPNEIKSNPPTHTPEISTRARKGHRLPADWQPKPLTPEVAAIVARWPAGAIERELARFRDWAASATGQVASKNDWDAAWRNWLRKADDEGRYRTANGTGQRTERQGTRAIGEQVAARLAAVQH